MKPYKPMFFLMILCYFNQFGYAIGVKSQQQHANDACVYKEKFSGCVICKQGKGGNDYTSCHFSVCVGSGEKETCLSCTANSGDNNSESNCAIY